MPEYTREELKSLLDQISEIAGPTENELKRCLYLSGSSHYTFINMIPQHMKTFIEKPLEEIPLFINDQFFYKKQIAIWRLRINK